jgi:hypothetical protein
MELLDIADEERASLVAELGAAALGIGELEPAAGDMQQLAHSLLESFDGWLGGRATGGS